MAINVLVDRISTDLLMWFQRLAVLTLRACLGSKRRFIACETLLNPFPKLQRNFMELNRSRWFERCRRFSQIESSKGWQRLKFIILFAQRISDENLFSHLHRFGSLGVLFHSTIYMCREKFKLRWFIEQTNLLLWWSQRGFVARGVTTVCRWDFRCSVGSRGRWQIRLGHRRKSLTISSEEISFLLASVLTLISS